MHVTEDDLRQVVAMIWETMLDLEVTPASTSERPVGHTLTGSVQINGDWNGDVRLRCGSDLAAMMAAAMFGTVVEDLAPEETLDALGELTNMTGGSVKGLLPGSCQLGLPTIAEGLDHNLVIPGSRVVSEAQLECCGQPIIVTLHEAA